MHRIVNLTAGGATGLTVLAGMMLTMPLTKAETEVVENVSISIPLSCTMGAVENEAHTRTITSGLKEVGIGATELTVYCNDALGFAIYAVGLGNDELGNTDMISDLGSTYDIHTGVYESGDVSSWGMKIEPVNGLFTASVVDFGTGQMTSDGYFAVPEEYTKVAYLETATGVQEEGGTGAHLTTTYYVYTKDTQPAGTYTGKVNYLMVHPSSATPATTLAQAFAQAGKEPVRIDGKDYYKMQDMTDEICQATILTGEATQTQLVDIRDNKIYWAAKLDDGHCWMTQNLALDLTRRANSGAADTRLSSLDTDINVIDSTSGSPYYTDYSQEGDVIYWNPTRNTVVSSTSFSGFNADTNTAYSAKNPQEWYINNETRFASTTCNYLSTLSEGVCADNFSQTPYESNGTHGAIGNYYNWSAAVASSGTSSLKSSTLSDPLEGNPKNSICPRGWRLPTVSSAANTADGSTNEFARLNYLYNGNKTNTDEGWFNAPLYFPRAGNVSNGSLNSAGNSGRYWSSTVYNSNYAYNLYFNSTGVDPADASYRNNGFSVRCVAGSL